MDDTPTMEYMKKKQAESVKELLEKPANMEKSLIFVKYKGRAYKIESMAIKDGKNIITIRPPDSELRKQGHQAALYRKINTLTVSQSETSTITNQKMRESFM